MTKRFLVVLLGLAALAGCISPETTVVDRAELNAIPADYRLKIKTWAKDFFADPHGLRSVQISDPVPARSSTGALLWLVCLDADAPAANGGYLGPQRFAFGFLKNGLFSAPLQRGNAQIAARDCDRLPLAWRPWPELQRL